MVQPKLMVAYNFTIGFGDKDTRRLFYGGYCVYVVRSIFLQLLVYFFYT